MKISEILPAWYEKNKRDLPWRHTLDPYRVWLSEVILQQTRVKQGLGYYLVFLENFPDVFSLAEAHEDSVMKLWQGLGYYTRARNLHETARVVAGDMGGEMPRRYEDLLKLKGVGSYTAAAIASICFGEPRAVVDGNVARVISRLFGVEEPVNGPQGNRIIARLAEEILDREQPGRHNQALMEFGSLQCIPSGPDCGSCPLAGSCVARGSGRVEMLPVKLPKRKPLKRWMYYYIMVHANGETILTRRNGNDIWRSLYQFPLVESERSLEDGELAARIQPELLPEDVDVTLEKISPEVKHQLTHRTLHAKFIHLRPHQWPDPLPADWLKIPVERLHEFPVPRLITRYLEVVNFSYLCIRNQN
ncbi:MAG: A/G-specific adenine glycosylase [Bacteroidales bacterium]